ncbi:hypothetical protein ACRE_021760 [Hapsidospora chrysogenum ATCC 11550]|uniref:Mid2 domain-containing protein n=1 Tax=Hapsidospora chrysogenum (strain ATCC 11550 / CBS 779.69 / DSM 880 / IAM 14645 / JCM 23072 / IMI 49137) TaxID=857340 RepID=A0A086TCC2_HAPC1|nr:hypothetical protein ACRE_021760 [Hapsidospora chrysogenum ATCC 11550]
MYSTRLLQLLFTGLAFASLAQAGAKYDSDGLMIPRQEDADGDILTVLPDDDDDDDSVTTPAPGPSTTEPDPSSSTSPTEDPDPSTTTEDKPPATATEDTTTTDPPTTTTADDKPTTTSKDDSPSSTTDKPDPTTTEDNGDGDEEEEEEQDATTQKPIISTAIETITRTNSDGSKETLTTSSLTTHTPEPQDGGDSDGGDGGLNDNTRKIVIGVVVGVGGAILLGALALVYWRIRNRKKQAEENEGLMEYNAGYTGPADKMEPPGSAATGTGTVPTSSGGGRSPFQTTLDTYHQPTPPVNASSNF